MAHANPSHNAVTFDLVNHLTTEIRANWTTFGISLVAARVRGASFFGCVGAREVPTALVCFVLRLWILTHENDSSFEENSRRNRNGRMKLFTFYV